MKNIVNTDYEFWFITQAGIANYDAILSEIKLDVKDVSEFEAKSGYNVDPFLDSEERGAPVAIIPVRGILMENPSFLDRIFRGAGSYNEIAGMIRSAADSGQKILLHISSPGGQSRGISTVSDAIQYAKNKLGNNGIVAHVSQATSAAYWISSHADRIFTDSISQIGGMGVLMRRPDISGMLEKAGVKVEVLYAGELKYIGNPEVKMTDEEREYLQDRLEKMYSLFVDYVAEGRSISGESIREKGARIYIGQEAVDENLADEVGDIFKALNFLSSMDKSEEKQEKIQASAENTVDASDKVLAAIGQLGTQMNSRLDEFEERIKGVEEQAKSTEEDVVSTRATTLVDTYISNGTIPPSKRDKYIEQAKVNYDFVSELLSDLEEQGSRAVPIGKRGPASHKMKSGSLGDTEYSSNEMEIFSQLGMVNREGKIDASMLDNKNNKLGISEERV